MLPSLFWAVPGIYLFPLTLPGTCLLTLCVCCRFLPAQTKSRIHLSVEDAPTFSQRYITHKTSQRKPLRCVLHALWQLSPNATHLLTGSSTQGFRCRTENGKCRGRDLQSCWSKMHSLSNWIMSPSCFGTPGWPRAHMILSLPLLGLLPWLCLTFLVK